MYFQRNIKEILEVIDLEYTAIAYLTALAGGKYLYVPHSP